MKIIKATKKYAKEISKLMLSDLKNPDKRFPKLMIKKSKEHAQEDGVLSEFSKSNLISFLALDNKNVRGFIAGYKEDKNHAMIHYINSCDYALKNELLKKFILFCKEKNMKYIITDSFEFFENHKLFLNNRFKLYKKEKITNKLEMLWLRLELN